MRRFPFQGLHLAIAAIAITVGVLAAIIPARAEFERELQLNMLTRIDLENAQTMLRYYEKAWAASKANGLRWMDWRTQKLETNGCNTPRPWNPEACEKIENHYNSVTRQIAVERYMIGIALMAQQEEVDRKRRDFQTAVANYIAQVALQAAMLAPERQVKPTSRQPQSTVRRPPPTRRRPPATSSGPKTDWWGEMRGMGNRLQRIQP